MTETIHPNMSILMKLNIQNLDEGSNIFADNFIWHYFNPKLPELEGDHYDIEGLKSFFVKLSETSNSSFQVNVIDAHPAGEELVITQVYNQMALDGNTFEFDAVVI